GSFFVKNPVCGAFSDIFIFVLNRIQYVNMIAAVLSRWGWSGRFFFYTGQTLVLRQTVIVFQ
ncbi:hypothetical protein BK147_30980, partial [Paenibacillus sp. FSL R7-0337]